MWKSKTFAIIISWSLLLLSGCGFFSIEPTYTKQKTVESIIELCRNEYKIEPRVWLLGETVWIYLPLNRLINKNIELDEEEIEKINKVMVSATRVLLSMKPRPQFLALVASDTQDYGIDYTIISWIPDIVKSQLQFISRDEFARRHIIKIEENTEAINDTRGDHIEKKEIKIEGFLAEQIAQRIKTKFSLDSKFKDYFMVKKVSASFKHDTFKIYADIKQIGTPPQPPINIQREITKIIAYVIKEYDFKDFLLVEIENPATGEKSVLSRLALRESLK